MKLSFSAKCSDLFGGSIIDDDGNVVKELDGYVPNGLCIGSGDYVEMTIDLDTGKIEDFKVDKEHIQSLIDDDDF